MIKTTEVFRPWRFDRPLFAVTLILIGMGLIMVYSTSGVLANEKYSHSFHFFLQQLIAAAMGMAGILIILSIQKPFYQNPLFVFGFLVVTIALLAGCLIMPARAETNRWIQIYGLSFQPSELAKISLILFLAYHLDRKKERRGEFQTLLFPLSVLFLVVLLILKEPDYGTALLLFIFSVLVLYIGGARPFHFLYIGLPSAALFLFYLIQAPYRLHRIIAFLWPSRDPTGKGFQVIQSKLAVGTGGIIGAGLGESTQKLFFLPCAHTDFIYAIVGEEFGLIGTLATLFLFLVLFWRGMAIARRAPNFFSQVAAAGLTLAVTLQALLNITIVLGMGPATGIPLPLLSFGRSSLVCTLLALGILLHISQRKTYEGNGQ